MLSPDKIFGANNSKAVANALSRSERSNSSGISQLDNRPEALVGRKLKQIVSNRNQIGKTAQLQSIPDKSSFHEVASDNMDITFVGQRNKLDHKATGIPIVQREKFKLDFIEGSGTVNEIKIAGRPNIKLLQNALDEKLEEKYPLAFKSHKLKSGFIRAHIIGWNVKQREYINSLGLPKTQGQLMTKFRKESFEDVEKQIKYELTQIFYDNTNYTINTEEAENEDRLVLRNAGQKYSQTGSEEDLKKIYFHSFNTGMYGDGVSKVEEYMASFSKAYGVPIETLQSWKLRIPEMESSGGRKTDKNQSSSTSSREMETSDDRGRLGMSEKNEEKKRESSSSSRPRKEKDESSSSGSRKRKGEGSSSSHAREDLETVSTSGNYVFEDGFQNRSEKWIAEAYNEFTTFTQRAELAYMLIGDYDAVDTHMQKIYKIYLKKIYDQLTSNEDTASAYEAEIRDIVSVLRKK